MPTEPTVEERLARLERAVAELQRAVASPAGGEGWPGGPDPAAAIRRVGSAPAPATGGPPGGATRGAPARAAAPPAPPRDWVAIGQLWIGRAGLAILALGLAFLFHYAVVRGWLTPQLRVGLGLLAGAALVVAGMRLHAAQSNRAYGLLLLGGGVGILYLSAYAAFGYYRLVSAGTAIAALGVLTLLAVRLAANREEVLLAHVGALGAFFAPVLVQGDEPSLLVLSGYIVLMVAWTGWTAVREGWRLLGWTAAAGAALLLALGQSAAVTERDRVLLVAAAGLSGVGLAAGLLWRQRAGEAAGVGWKVRPVRWMGLTPEEADRWSAAALAAVVGLAAPVYIAWVMQWPDPLAGYLALMAAVVLGACAWAWRDAPALARTVALAAAIPLLVGTALLDLRVFRGAFALEALALLLVGTRARAPLISALGHVEFVLVALTFLSFIGQAGQQVPAGVLVTDLLAVGAALYATGFLPEPVAVRAYGVAALVAFLGWILVALLPLEGGQYWVTIAWGALGSGLLIAASLRSEMRLRVAALIVLAAVAIKLLAVDTAALPPGGRVLVFLGFGALFLVLAALYRRGALDGHGSTAEKPNP